jgi:hypothetical protein
MPIGAGEQPKPAQIDRNGVLILVRSALIALDQANKTGNYTVLRDLGAPAFQGNSAARLGEIFAGLRHDSLDLSGVVVIDPQLTLLPQIDAEGMMRMTGFFPSAPAQINFDLVYAPVNGQWRLFAITVGLGQTAPAAPAQAVKKPQPKNSDQRRADDLTHLSQIESDISKAFASIRIMPPSGSHAESHLRPTAMLRTVIFVVSASR